MGATSATPTNSTNQSPPVGSKDAWSLCWWINNIPKLNLPSPWEIAWKPDIVGSDYAVVLKNGVKYALVVQGTQLFNLDLGQDLDVTNWNDFVPVANAKVADGPHSGLERMFDKNFGGDVNLHKYLVSISHEWAEAHPPLLVTGHSLGGTLAALAATRIGWFLNGQRQISQLPTNIQAITFAAFAAGNQAFAEFLDNSPNYLPCFNKNDLVPHVWATDPKLNPLFNVCNSYKLFPSPGPSPMDTDTQATIAAKVAQMLKNGISYVQTTGPHSYQFEGDIKSVDLDSKNPWQDEAGYQHNDAYNKTFGSGGSKTG